MVTFISMASTGSIVTGTANAGSPAATLVAANNLRKSVLIYNNSSSTIYISPDAGSTNAFPLLPQTSITDEDSTSIWYGYAAASSNVRFIEVSTPEGQ